MHSMSPRERAEHMKAAADKFDRKVEKLCKWHKWFAWHPVRASGKIKWLTFVGRKYAVEGNPVEGYTFKPYITKPEYCSSEDMLLHLLRGENEVINLCRGYTTYPYSGKTYTSPSSSTHYHGGGLTGV